MAGLSRRNEPFMLFTEMMNLKIDQQSIMEESPMCRVIHAIYNNDLAGLIEAIINGGRLTDTRFNALEYAMAKVQYPSRSQIEDGRLDICYYLITNHSALITAASAKKLLEMNKNKISTALVNALTKGLSSLKFCTQCSLTLDNLKIGTKLTIFDYIKYKLY